ncbi:uncharacterized protein LOC133789574 [Humulus lupulus]|uniref:uncharacterized protein LOC133789574 n=1 Tax=Humulus lupulus TaxID=3486 RepID=UPI002B40F466|nr:uncharacterized protein LOC133789574 [Humulus lupulus]
MTTIIGVVAKLRGCINQIENKNPSGASQEDIEIITNSTEIPIGMKKAKTKQLGDDQFNKLMEQSKKLVKVNEKSNTDRNERHKRKTEDKILFMDLDFISDPEFRQYIQSEKRRIYREKTRTSEVGEQGEGSQYQRSQYRASRYQGQSAQDEGQRSQDQGERSENDSQDYSLYFDYLDGTGNNFPHY